MKVDGRKCSEDCDYIQFTMKMRIEY